MSIQNLFFDKLISITFQIILNEILYLLLLMKFVNHYFYKTPLFLAIDKRNVEIVKLLLSNPEIEVNISCILNLNFLAYYIHILQFANEVQKLY